MERQHATILEDYMKNCPAEVDGGPGIEDSLQAGADALRQVVELARENSRLRSALIGLRALVKAEMPSLECVDIDKADSALANRVICGAVKHVERGSAECQRETGHIGPHISGGLGWE